MNAVVEIADSLPLLPLCSALGVSRATIYRRRAPATSTPTRPKPARALESAERTTMIEVLTSERFVDRSPAEVFYTLLDEGQYVGSERTMYRALAELGEVRERRNQRKHPAYTRPELVATGPNQVWSWDISRLRTTVKFVYLYLYVVLDIFSRKVVGWMVAREENAFNAKILLAETIEKEGIAPATLVLHADRGAQMRSKTLAQLLAELDVARSFSRPHTSDDNPFSEAQFKTAKYHSSYPGKFVALEDALAWGRLFFPWYNDEHRHSGIAYLTPANVHAGRAEELLQLRHEVILGVYSDHPERFPNGAPRRLVLPPAVYINPPIATEATSGEPQAQPNVVAVEAAEDAGGWGRAASPGPASDASVGEGADDRGAITMTKAATTRAPLAAAAVVLAENIDLNMQAGLHNTTKPTSRPDIASADTGRRSRRRAARRESEVALQ